MLLYLTAILLNSTALSYHCDLSPSGQRTTCVPLKQCEYINEIVSLPTNYLPNGRFISMPNISYCGFDLMGPKVCCPIKTQNSILDFLLNNFKFETNHFQVPNTRFVLHKSSTSQAPPTSKAPPTSQALPTSQASSNSQTTLNSQSPNQIYVHDEKTLLTEISDLPENFLPKSCGEIDTPKIFGGNIAGIFEFSWMVFLYYQSGSRLESSCGGTIINERYILTAAHCLTTLGKNPIKVRVGEYNLNTDPDCYAPNACAPGHQEIEINRTILHPYYDSTTSRNDIGLIRLARPLNFSDSNVAAICLPLTTALMNKKFANTTLKITGWGMGNESDRSESLQKADIPFVTFGECRKIFKENDNLNLTSGHMCAGGNESRACEGDSGGPLINSEDVDGQQRYVQHGIISLGPRSCNSKRAVPVIFTRVSYYMKWIIRQFKKYK